MNSLNTIITALIVAGVFALHPSLNKGNTPITNLHHFVYGNSLNISTNKTINRNLLEVKWLCETNETPCNYLVVFKNGIQINEIPSVKGNQKLVVLYNNEKIGEINQNKSTGNQAHDYNITFSLENNAIFFEGEIIGPSPHQRSSAIVASL